jgi:hypothetical protein
MVPASLSPGVDVFKFVALEVLGGVGDRALGQWEEVTNYMGGGPTYRVRRRLTDEEVERFKVGEARDLRGTPEGLERAKKALRECPWLPMAYVLSELEVPNDDPSD